MAQQLWPVLAILAVCHVLGAFANDVKTQATMEVDSNGASMPQANTVMRREAGDSQQEKDAQEEDADDSSLDADAAKYDEEVAKKTTINGLKVLVKNDCTGLKVANACSEPAVKASARDCESYKAPTGSGQYYRCSWKQSVPNHGDDPAQPPECYADAEAGPCSTVGDSSDAPAKVLGEK
eukprot:gb/GFBE01065109.1/.p1 GENE.gb/GFBE01065109.1/~~gb/GFBE01065109.1/.p1  ORF type:complete len:180 (+),score=48.01 gb/GFBE01065109.1/:1-540(+)